MSSGAARSEHIHIPEVDVFGQLLLPEVWRDPYPFYAELRRRGVTRHVGALPGYVFARYADVSMLLWHPHLSHRFPLKYACGRRFDADEARQHASVLTLLSRGWMQAADAHFHLTIRRRLAPLFSRKHVARIEDQIRAACARFAQADGRRSLDFMSAFAEPLVMEVLGRVLGIPARLWVQVSRCSSAIAAFLGTADLGREEVADADREVRLLSEMLVPVIAARRQDPRADVISVLSAATEIEISPEDLALQCALTMAAGLETTVGLLGNSLLALLRHPETLRKVRAKPTLLAATVEECLRYDSPGQWLPRVAHETVAIGGFEICAGELLWLGLGSANRDPEHFPAADCFDIAREQGSLMSFGGGAHYCLGAHLARLETRIALDTVLAAFNDIELDSAEVPYRENFAIRSPQSLPIRVRY